MTASRPRRADDPGSLGAYSLHGLALGEHGVEELLPKARSKARNGNRSPVRPAAPAVEAIAPANSEAAPEDAHAAAASSVASASTPEVAPLAVPADLAPVPEPKRSIPVRLFSLVMLGGVIALLGLGASSAYHAFTDSFVAPLSLSPDSDSVIQSKVTMSRLLSERAHLVARIEADTASIQAAERTATILGNLQKTSHRGSKVAGDTSSRKELTVVLKRQEEYVAALQADLAAGLIHGSDLVREENTLNHIRVALLQNEREDVSAQTQAGRVELDLLKNEAEQRAQIAERRASQEELARVDELLAELQQRPMFVAVEKNQTLAFVPYSQLDRVIPGADVYTCTMWGILGCTRVGTVTSVLPGEVVAQDPWGSTARGEYALLELTDRSAAQAKSLRVRSSGKPEGVPGAPAPPVQNPDPPAKRLVGHASTSPAG